MEEVLTKKCPSCKIKKSKTQFYKNKSKKDKLNTYCKLCIKNKIKIKRDLEIKERLEKQYIKDEEWKIMPSPYEDYEASTLSRIRHFTYKTLLTTTTVGEDGYCRCGLGSVHRLIALTFIENPENKETINHINYNCSDNRIENLEWMTQKENNIHKNLRKRNPIKKEDKPILKNFHNEKWKILEKHLGYSVSIFGRIKNIKTGIIYNGIKTANGYLVFPLKRKLKKMHRLVASAFSPIPDKLKTQINHIDGNKTNNKLSNLEWTTPSENMCHAYNTDLAKTKRKIYQLTENNKIKNEWDSIIKAANALKINRNNIQNVLSGRNNMTNGYYWCYKKNYDSSKTYLGKIKKKIKQSHKKTGEFIKTWDSIDEVAKQISLERNSKEKSIEKGILRCLKGNAKSYLKFKWEYCEN